MFERGYAETLGLSVESGMPLRFSTAMGSFDAYGHTVTLETLGYSFDVTVYFAAEESFTRNVLGRRGWLDQVRPSAARPNGALARPSGRAQIG
jgi:voltage-gated potassium channel Kch